MQNARRDLVGEIEAIIQYDSHIHMTNDRMTIDTLQSIKQEELAHVGELLALINQLDPSQQQYVQKGIDEFDERMRS